MGQAKAQWMEQQEEEYRQAHWECPKCECENISEVDIPSISEVGDPSEMYASERQEIECENCGKIFKGTIHNSIGGIEFEFKDKKNNPIDIQHVSQHGGYGYEPDEDDYYWEPSDSPGDVYSVTMDGMRLLLKTDVPIAHDEQLLNRVVFAQVISALEAFLSDTLINLVKGDPEIQQSLYEKDIELGKKKFTAAEILADNSLPEKYLLSYLREKISFHNLPTANKLFNAALDGNIFVDEAHKNVMIPAIILRHDCVHRNGKTVTGEKQTCFTKDYVKSIADATDEIVSRVRHMTLSREFDDISE